jgi:hypothetical protein
VTRLRRLAERPAVRALVFVLLVKALLVVFGVIAFEVLTNRRADGVLAIWNRWDARHYLWLAEHGYSSQGEEHWLIAFLPLLPWLIRGVAALGVDYAAAGFLVATLASLAAAELLRRLASLDAGEDEAERAVLFLFIFPTSYFLHVPYTEGLFLALTLGGFLAARRRRWAWAGALGGLASLARVTGVVLLPALALEAFAEWRETRRLRAAWLSLLGVGAGAGVYLALNQAVMGSPFAFMAAHHEHWFRSTDWPWNGLVSLGRAYLSRGPNEAHMLGAQELLFSLVAFGATFAVARTQRASYAFWMAANWAIFVGQSFVYCVPRFCLTLFPLFLLFARLSRRPPWAAVLGLWSLLFLALFASLYVQGRWAF